MHFIRCLIAGSALLATTLLAGSALASDNKIALIPGGPHPYFKPWEQAAADAKKDFGIASVDFKVPTDWKLKTAKVGQARRETAPTRDRWHPTGR